MILRLSAVVWRFFYIQQLLIFCADGWICSRISSWNGKINCADDTFRNRNSRNENRLDLWNISKIQIIEDFVYFLSGILDHYDHPAGDLLYFC